MDTAEAAVEGAAYTCMVDRSAFAKEGRAQVFFHGKAVKGRPWELIRALHLPLSIVVTETEHVLVGKTWYRVERTLATKCIEKLNQSVFPLSASDVVYVACVKRRIRIDGWKVAAPADGNLGMETANLARGLHRRYHLGARHHRDAQQLDLILGDKSKDARRRIVIEIPIDDLVVLSSFERRSESKDGKRQSSVLRPCSTRMIEDDHAFTLAT
jgi:hypothetical protein